MSAFAAWWRMRTLRERRLLLVMFAMFAGAAVWLLVVRPLADAEAHARARHARAADALAAARAEAGAVARLERQVAPRLGGPVEGFLARSLAEAGFTTGRAIAAGPHRAHVTIDAARPQAAFGWIESAQAAGLVVERLRAAANSDRTVALEATLRVRGR